MSVTQRRTITLSIYRASIPVFLRGLDVLSVLLDRAAAHAKAHSFDVGVLLAARLAPLDELRRRIDATADYLKTFQPEQFDDDNDERKISYNAGGAPRQSSAQDYLLNFALPNFFFHVATAHDILRHNGLAIGKREYLGYGRE
jgi:hypothetical protein